MITKKETIQLWREKLGEDPAWALRGLMRIYAEQTESEKEYGVTAFHNGRGFTGVDADILTSFAKRFEWKGSLTGPQMAVLFDKMPKYATQLYRLTHPKKQEQAAEVA
jgi:hypothetical protein